MKNPKERTTKKNNYIKKQINKEQKLIKKYLKKSNRPKLRVRVHSFRYSIKIIKKQRIINKFK